MALATRVIAAAYSALGFHARRYALTWATALVALVALAIAAYAAIAPPRSAVLPATVVVEEGELAPQIAGELADTGIVRHPGLLRLVWRISGTAGSIAAGAYRFERPSSLLTVAWRLTHGAYGIKPVAITFPEGFTARDMAERVHEALPHISIEDFISTGQPYEGYLFPDTYTLSPADTAASIVAAARATFEEKTAPMADDIVASGHTRMEIVTMASIIEREAARHDDRRMISGILWNRIERGIPLQVDAVFGYIYSRKTYSPSYDDLTIDSPYNTYKYAGLPPGPISNPSLDAIDAALHPAKTDYLFYLTGRDGVNRYSRTYQGHAANLESYLR
jgi:UPF0755 protein